MSCCTPHPFLLARYPSKVKACSLVLLIGGGGCTPAPLPFLVIQVVCPDKGLELNLTGGPTSFLNAQFTFLKMVTKKTWGSLPQAPKWTAPPACNLPTTIYPCSSVSPMGTGPVWRMLLSRAQGDLVNKPGRNMCYITSWFRAVISWKHWPGQGWS